MARFFVDCAIIASADTLPRAVADRMVRGIAFVEWALTAKGRAATNEAREVCGRRGAAARKLAREYVGIPYRDVLDMRRAAEGRDDLRSWTVEEVNGGEMHALLDAGKPVMVVMGHFATASSLGLVQLFPRISGAAAAYPIEPFAWDGHVLRRRQNWKISQRLIARLQDEGIWQGDAEFAWVGQTDVQGMLLRQLATPGGVAVVYADIEWHRPNAVRMPFCGQREWPLALGATRIARLGQAPMILVVPERIGRRSVRVHYSEAILPPAADDKPADVANMRRLLSDLERYIGRFRGQYMQPVGWERHWDPAAERWIDPQSVSGTENG